MEGLGDETHLVAQLRDELLVARQDVCAVLNETAEGPEAERWLAVLLDHIQMGVVDTPPHLARLLDDGVDSLRERVVEDGKSRLRGREGYDWLITSTMGGEP